MLKRFSALMTVSVLTAMSCAPFGVDAQTSGEAAAAPKPEEAALAALRSRQMLSCASPLRGRAGPLGEKDFLDVQDGANAGLAGCQLLLGRWFEEAANVGRSGWRSEYVVPSMPKARALYEAASVKNGRGHAELGRLAEEQFMADYALARSHYAKAVEHEAPAGEVALARLYSEGLGGAKDTAEALRVLRKGAYRGDEQCWKAMQKLTDYNKLSDEQQGRADLAQWQQQYWQRIGRRLQVELRSGALPGAGSGTWRVAYAPGATYPDVSVAESTGLPELDRAVRLMLTSVMMAPPPPIAGGVVIQVPMSIEPKRPANAASAASAP